jgi:hypothetical protein
MVTLNSFNNIQSLHINDYGIFHALKPFKSSDHLESPDDSDDRFSQDVYSFGLVLLEMISSRDSSKSSVQQILSSFSNDKHNEYAQLVSLIAECTAKEAKQRPSTYSLVQSLNEIKLS